MRRKSSNVYAYRKRKHRRAAGTRFKRSFNSLAKLKGIFGFVVVAAITVFFTWRYIDPQSVQVSTNTASSSSSNIIGRASVIDGDTLEIHGQRVRLYGVDAPESSQTCRDEYDRDYRCGQRAANALADKIGQRTVSCDRRDVDRYGRVVAVCTSGGEDLNGWLVRQGWAVAYRRYSTKYVSFENGARSAKQGIWAGTFMTPEEWRRQNL